MILMIFFSFLYSYTKRVRLRNENAAHGDKLTDTDGFSFMSSILYTWSRMLGTYAEASVDTNVRTWLILPDPSPHHPPSTT